MVEPQAAVFVVAAGVADCNGVAVRATVAVRTAVAVREALAWVATVAAGVASFAFEDEPEERALAEMK